MFSLALVDFILYETSSNEADAAQEELCRALATCLDVPVEEVSVVFTPEGKHIGAKFLVKSPSEENRELCDGHVLPRKLREEINDENILPNQKSMSLFFLLLTTLDLF